MTNVTVFVIAAAVTVIGAYLCGSVPFGLLIGKAKGIDIRKAGSGNIGATNVTRVVGKGWGKLCFALDFVKGCLPVLMIKLIVGHCSCVQDDIGLLPALAAFFAVCGHIWPVWIGFKGGKGVSTAGGAILALSPIPVLTGLAAWGGVFFASRYVSLASITAAIVVPVAAFLCNVFHFGSRASVPDLVLFCILCAMTIIKHTSNIKRLCNGTENRFEKKKPEEKA